MKRFFYIFILFGGKIFSQQLPQYSQYMLNEMAINPAVAGKDDFAEVRSNNRHQWTGITDAPRTYMLTLQGPIATKHMGLGMNLYTDIVGPTRRTGLSASYAYHLQLDKEKHLSFGLSAGFLQWGIDGDKITLGDETDNQFLPAYRNTVVPDFGAGLYFYVKKKYYFGFAVPQLYQSPIPLYPGAYKKSSLRSQFNINGAYIFEVNEDFKIEPSFLLKYEYPAPIKLDIGVRGIYKNLVWIGTTFRTQDAVSILVGYFHQDYLTIGYSYDFSTTRLAKYSNSTHELMLGINFSRKQAKSWEK